MSEASRRIPGLRSMGWPDMEITDFILWVATGDKKHKPRPKED